MTNRDKWPVRVKPFREAPDGEWRAVSFERDGVEGTYGNVSIQCPGCEYEWDENAQRVQRECARALNAEPKLGVEAYAQVVLDMGKAVLVVRCGDQGGRIRFDGRHEATLRAAFERPTDFEFRVRQYAPKVTLEELLEQAERQGVLLALVNDSGEVMLSGDTERLEGAHKRIQARMSLEVSCPVWAVKTSQKEKP
jgi:hypothetical protein